MNKQTLEEQLVAKDAEIARLNALLPPAPTPGQTWRCGSENGANLYAHADGLAPCGEAVGQMRSPELAAHVARALNAFDWDGQVSEGRKVLDLPMDGDHPTIRDYLIALLAKLWRQGADFNGKRPFGKSSWEYDLYRPLAKAGLITATLEDDCFEDCDDEAGDRLIAAAIAELGVAR